MSGFLFVLGVVSCFGMFVGTLATGGEMWKYFTRERRLERRYRRNVWDRAEPYILLGASPEDAFYQAQSEMRAEAVEALKA